MKRKWLIAAAALPIAAAGVAVLTPTRAADHADSNTLFGDGVGIDPAADITDIYAFTPSSDATTAASEHRVVFVMNVAPSINPAAAGVKLSDKVEYAFRIKQVTGTDPVAVSTANYDITCTADNGATQQITCQGPNGLSKTVAVGTTGTCAATDPICVFAGPRSDPFFFDLDAYHATSPDAGSKFCVNDAGTNFFKNANVMSIVVEVDALKLIGDDGGGTPPILTVAGETKRNP